MKVALPFAVAALVTLSNAALGEDLDRRIAAPQFDPANLACRLKPWCWRADASGVSRPCSSM